MRKVLIAIFALIVVIILASCNDIEGKQTGNNLDKQETREQEVNEKDEGKEQDSQETDKSQPVINPMNEDAEDEADPDSEVVKPDVEESVEPQYQLTDIWSVEPISDQANEKVVLLTIDDSPDQLSVDMAKTLKSSDAKAIFFVNGHFLVSDEGKEKLKQIYNMGFTIGNHTFNHQRLPDVSEEKQLEEIIRTSELIEEITGERPKFFRAPNGLNTDFSKQLAKDEGMLLMNWTYGYDYFEPYMDAEKLTTAMVTGEGPEVDVPYSLLQPGANLLMHDREWTAKALEDIVTGLRDKGFEMVDPALIKTPFQ